MGRLLVVLVEGDALLSCYPQSQPAALGGYLHSLFEELDGVHLLREFYSFMFRLFNNYNLNKAGRLFGFSRHSLF